MKLAFSTLGCPDWTFAQILENGQKMGFKGIEIRGIEGEMDVAKIKYFQPSQWKDTKKRLEDHNLEIINLGTSANFHDAAKWDAGLAEAKAAIDMAESIGVPFIRIFGDKLPDTGAERENTLRQIAKGWLEVYRYSEGKKVTPLVEVHGNFNRVESFKDIFKFFEHPKFAVIWDIEHSYKVYEDNFIEFFGFIRKYTKHVHIKDAKKINGEWQLTNLGKGTTPIAMHVALLSASNYGGYLSLEWEKKWHPELDDCSIAFPEYVELMKKIIFIDN
ncbi:MAG: sugar phosphate isomerase/epimerase [Treponema sp.]|nr:sugar phosphate isomerase/epimerase [Treponema sp.]